MTASPMARLEDAWPILHVPPADRTAGQLQVPCSCSPYGESLLQL